VALANGIAAAGVQLTHPPTDTGLEGLLPDSFNLEPQTRNPPGINPGTLLPEAIQMYGQDPLYDFHAFPHHGLMVHAPGPITDCQETSQGVSFSVDGWPGKPWYVLISGSTGGTLIVDSVQTPAPPGPLTLGFDAPATVEFLAPAQDTLRLQRSSIPGQVQLSWPLAGTNYLLEFTGSLSGNPHWQAVTNAVAIAGSQFLFTAPASQPAQFFRLRRVR
jgi:hypothetical protein